MALVIGKRIIPMIALAAGLFFSFPVNTYGQGFVPTPDIDTTMMQGNQQIASGTASFSTLSTAHDKGEDGPPSARRRLGFPGWREDMFNVLSSLGALIAWLGGFLLDASISIFTVGMYDATVYFKLDRTIEAMWAVI